MTCKQTLELADSLSKYISTSTVPSLHWGTGAGVLDGGGRQQPVAMGGRNVGNGRVREGMIVSPRPSLSLALPCSLSRWPRSPTQRRAVSPQKNKPLPLRRANKTWLVPPHPSRGGRANLTFQRPAPKTSVKDGVRGEESHAVSPRRLDFRPDVIHSLIRQRGCVDRRCRYSQATHQAIRQPDRSTFTNIMSAQGCTTLRSSMKSAWPVLSSTRSHFFFNTINF